MDAGRVAELEKILTICRETRWEQFAELLFSDESPEGANIHYMPRLNLAIDGDFVFRCFRNGQFEQTELSAPAIYYCTRDGYQMLSRRQTPQRALSFCYLPEYVRVVFCDYDGITPPPTERDIYYHSAVPLSEGGRTLITAFETLQQQGETRLAWRLLSELFQLTCRELAAAPPAPNVNQSRLWSELNTWLRTHREEPVSRKLAARALHISPGYVSRLVKRYSGDDFVTLANNYKLEHAAMLLRESKFTIDEIAERCGFRYRSYFDRRFKLRYAITPFQYRDASAETSAMRALTAADTASAR